MKVKLNYFLIPLIVIAVAVLGSIFSASGMNWYETQIIKPVITPPNWIFPIAWTTIFALASVSTLLIWNVGRRESRILWVLLKKGPATKFWWIIGLLIANAILNIGWSLLFFQLHLIFPAFIEMFVLQATTIAIIILAWRISITASILLLPYMIWVGFATYLTYLIYHLNSGLSLI